MVVEGEPVAVSPLPPYTLPWYPTPYPPMVLSYTLLEEEYP